MKEFMVEDGQDVDLSMLQVEWMPEEDYSKAVAGIVYACHDVVLDYHGRALLVERDNFPAKGILWPIGGRIAKGVKAVDSLRQLVEKESSLQMESPVLCGMSRTFWQTDPFGHGKGVDTVNLMYFALATGEIKLDELHKNPTLVLPSQYTSEFRNSLHPYARAIMDMSVPLLR